MEILRKKSKFPWMLNNSWNNEHTENTVSLNQRNIYFIYGQRKNFFELKKVLLFQIKILWSNEINLFTLKMTFLNQQNFLHFKEIFSLTAYQRNCFLGAFFNFSQLIIKVNLHKQLAKYQKYFDRLFLDTIKVKI